MRILILASKARSLINFRGALVQTLIEKGCEVYVGAPDIPEPIRAMLESWGAKVIETPLQRRGLSPTGDLSYMWGLVKLMRELKPDRVLTYTAKPNIWGGISSRITKVKSVAMVTGLGYAFTETGQKRSLKDKIVRSLIVRLYRFSAAGNWRIIFQNKDDLFDFRRMGCLKSEEKARLVNGSGVDLDQFPRSTLPDAPVFLMVSRILKNKGVREFAQAALIIKAKYPDVEIVLVGPKESGPDSIASEEILKWQKGGLEIVGPVDDVTPYLSRCSVYVLPSYREGTPRSVLEAMSTGRPILTTDAPGCRETTESGVNGWLVPVRDSDALATKMEWMIENSGERFRMAQNSRKIVEEKYAVEKVNKVMIEHLGVFENEVER